MAYIKETFYPKSIEHAKDICLSPDSSKPNKFLDETKFLVDFLKEKKYVNPTTKILDFGCGVGRVAKMLIEDVRCKVIGVDISEPMLNAAVEYVNNKDFIPGLYKKNTSTEDKPKFDLIIATFVLQHSEHPIEDIKFIKELLVEGGTFVLVNEGHRYVPSDIDKNNHVIWDDDGINIIDELSKSFKMVGQYDYYGRNDKPLTIWKKQNRLNNVYAMI